jgi:hypothetical protein
MDALDHAIDALAQALADPLDESTAHWRWRVGQQLAAAREALSDDQVRSWDGWLVARASAHDRDRHQLIARLTALGQRVLDRLDPERARAEMHRLVLDLEHYRQRLHDLAYDSVSLELGGSE